VITGIVAGLVALIAFFALGYYHVGVHVGTIRIDRFPTGRDLAGSRDVAGGMQQYAILWLVPLAGLASLIVGLLPLGVRSFTQRTAGIVFLVSGILGALALLLTLVRVNSDVEKAFNASRLTAAQLARLGLTYGFSFGFWLSVVAMIALIVAGALALRGDA
jgi:hypothetical protein